MSQNEIHQGQRLEALLASKWRFKIEAAEALSVYRHTLYRWLEKPVLSPSWHRRYAPVLESFGLNPAYISDPDVSMRPDADQVADLAREAEALRVALEEMEQRISRLTQQQQHG